jgi:hypothetical protein
MPRETVASENQCIAAKEANYSITSSARASSCGVSPTAAGELRAAMLTPRRRAA